MKELEIPPNESIYSNSGQGVKVLETLEETVRYNNYLISKVLPYLKRKNLELGAGRGTLSELISKTHPIEIFEIAEDNYRYLNGRFQGIKNVEKIERDFLLNTSFLSYDCIYSSNVLEHIQNDEDFVLHGMRLLKKGGHFVAIVPAMMALYSEFDIKIGHLRRYQKEDKLRLINSLQKNSIPFRFSKYTYMNPVGAIGWYLKMRLLKQKEIQVKDSMMMNTLIPFLKHLDHLPLPFGQSILIVIEKY